MNAGALRQRITIRYAASSARSASGAQSVTPGTLATLWSRRTDIGGQETWRGRQLSGALDAVFQIRFRSDVTRQMQVVHGSETFEIEAVQRVGNKDEALELLCRNIAA